MTTTDIPQTDTPQTIRVRRRKGVRRVVVAVAVLGAAFLSAAVGSMYAAIWTHGGQRQSWLVTAAVSVVIAWALAKTAARIVEEMDR